MANPGEGLTVTDRGAWVIMKKGKGKARLAQVVAFETIDGGGLRKVVTGDGEWYIEDMSSKGAALDEIADVMGVSKSTLYAPHNKTRVQSAYQRGVSRCNIGLRHRQVEKAMDGDSRMLEWLGRVRLGQREAESSQSSELADFVRAISGSSGDPEEE